MKRRSNRLVVIALAGLLSGFLAAALLSGCSIGGSDEEQVARVTVTAPTDGSSTKESRITVRGTVAPPEAQVTVMGRSAQVANGVFSVSVPLKTGNNDIDVVATGPDITPGSTTILVKRKSSSSSKDNDDKDTSNNNSTGGADTASGYKNCGDTVQAGPNTTCAFAFNVRTEYNNSSSNTIRVYSPVTDRTYTMYCTPGDTVVCRGGNNASVSFTYAE
jgi:hypothetical protein